MTTAIAASAQMPNVFDHKSLAEMQARARKDPDGSLKMVAKQFEAYFIGLMLKQARESMAGTMMDSNQTKMFSSLADEQLSMTLSNSGGFGFADMLVRQMEQRNTRVGSRKEIDPETEKLSTEEKLALDATNAKEKMEKRVRSRNDSMPSSLTAYGLQENDRLRNQRADINPTDAIEKTDEENEMAMSLGIMVRFRDAQNQLNQASQRSRAASYYAQTAATGNQQTQSATDTSSYDDRDQFVATLRPHAEEASKITGIPARYMIGHAALETGWGRRQILDENGNNSHNLFGIKAGRNWTGAVAKASTTEYVNGQAQRQVEPFRSYASYRDAFIDYANLLISNPRYSDVATQKTPAKFAQSLQDAGYATDPNYATKLESVILARKLNGIS